jgi:hypothetical protein
MGAFSPLGYSAEFCQRLLSRHGLCVTGSGILAAKLLDVWPRSMVPYPFERYQRTGSDVVDRHL